MRDPIAEMATVGGWFRASEGSRLMEYAEKVASAGGPLVEVGSFYGKSTSALASVAERHEGCVVYAIDLWRRTEDTHAGMAHYPYKQWANGESFEHVFVENMQRLGHSDVVKRICEPSHLAPKHFEDDSIGFILHDASHEFDAVAKDIAAWLPKLRNGAFWCHHDYDWDGGRAIDQCQQLQRIEIVSSLGIFRVVKP